MAINALNRSFVEGEHPIPTPINPAKVSVVAVVYDNDDTSRTTTAGKTGNSADTPRAANSATPKSTAYDEQNEPPKVVTYEENLIGNTAEVSAMLEDEDGIGSAYCKKLLTDNLKVQEEAMVVKKLPVSVFLL